MNWLLTNPLTLAIAKGIGRHALTVAGGWLVEHGYVSNDQATQAIGAVIVLVGIIFSALEKQIAHGSAPAIDAPKAAVAILMADDAKQPPPAPALAVADNQGFPPRNAGVTYPPGRANPPA